jgi:hypothetical protein
MMDIIITRPSPEYEKFNVEIPFSYTLNLKGVEFNSYAEPKRS